MPNLPGRLKSLIASLTSVAGQTERGAALAARGQTAAGFRLLAKAAQAGGAKAQYQVGLAYLRGEAVPASVNDAVFWLERAARAGLPEAQHIMAALAMQGLNQLPSDDMFARANLQTKRAPDYDAARSWAQQAVDSGWPESKALLACLYNYGPAAWHDPAVARKLNREAAGADCAQGRLGLAAALLESNQPDDQLEARRELQAACAAGLPAAHLMLGSLDASSDPQAAAEHFRIAAEAGLPAGKLRYGIALLDGAGVKRDQVAGESWLRRAALEGEVAAAEAVAELYLGGDGLPPNMAEAAIWLRVGAEHGDALAARRLGQLCLRQGERSEGGSWLQRAAALGDDVARLDLARLALARGAPAQADLREWLTAKAEAGDMAARFNLGVCCAEAVGGERNDQAALEHFRIAATLLPAARYWLGRLKIEGRGQAVDLAAGRVLLEHAARDGVIDAQLLAAEMMVNGRGGPVDVPGGYQLFHRAAAANHPGAIYSLGVLKAGGHGIAAEPATALEYFRAAARMGHPRAALMAGRYLAYGIGAPADRREAGVWLRRAREAHRDEAEHELAQLRSAA